MKETGREDGQRETIYLSKYKRKNNNNERQECWDRKTCVKLKPNAINAKIFIHITYIQSLER